MIVQLKTLQLLSMKQKPHADCNDKTKVMKLLPSNNLIDNVVFQGHTFEKVNQFTYLGDSISDSKS